ncbi:MAG TPA: DUF4922 domain-containing protein [Blastocatellia bacterium]|nr:DUF4922 domain-containing protein [Blastocatellia bacterium]
MKWESRIVTDKELRPFLAQASTDLTVFVSALITQQRATWPLLREAVAALAQVEVRHFEIKGSPVVAQFNPARIVSTAAKVDAASISRRPCFLCPDNLPPEEKGIAFGSDFVILCNPFPVLPNHLVIAHREHTPQQIAGNFDALLDVAAALGPDYFALYNGPACGASAPDHLHFQACESRWLPIFADAEKRERRFVAADSKPEVFTLPGYRLNVLIARSSDRQALAEWFARVTERLAAVTQAASEPLLNLVIRHDGAAWTVCFFPRSRHRPARYFAGDEARLTISPAGIDLAGVVVVPEAAHFARLTADDLEQIYAEVTLDDLRFAQWLAQPDLCR